MISIIRTIWLRLLNNLFKKKKEVKIGLYGPPNAGKTTLANKICGDWLGEEMGTASGVAHETREIQIREEVTINKGDRSLTFNLVDTPGIATKIDYEEFLKEGIPEDEAKQRAKEATKGVIDSIKWLDDMDAVVVVLDSTTDPYSQVNVTILGNLEARDVPVLLVGNKVDTDQADIKKMRQAFPQYDIVGISALQGDNIEDFYEALFTITSNQEKN